MFFLFNATATPEIYTYCHTLSLHDALPISARRGTTSSRPRPSPRPARSSPARPSIRRCTASAGTSRVVLRCRWRTGRSEEHTSELQSLMRISYAVFCLKKKKRQAKYKEERKVEHSWTSELSE